MDVQHWLRWQLWSRPRPPAKHFWARVWTRTHPPSTHLRVVVAEDRQEDLAQLVVILLQQGLIDLQRAQQRRRRAQEGCCGQGKSADGPHLWRHKALAATATAAAATSAAASGGWRDPGSHPAACSGQQRGPERAAVRWRLGHTKALHLISTPLSPTLPSKHLEGIAGEPQVALLGDRPVYGGRHTESSASLGAAAGRVRRG